MHRTRFAAFLILVASAASVALLRAQDRRLRWPPEPRFISIGERPALEDHLDQALVDSGEVGFDELIEHGRAVFSARWNTLDGQGRPASTGTGAPRLPGQPRFVRTSAPDSNSCAGCHAQPRVGGAGDFVANVFVLAQARDPVTFSVASTDSDERNTLGMFGSGAIELLAREMTAELVATREAARAEAASAGAPARRELRAKAISFGAITVFPDGRVDPTEIEGVDWDLVVRPFAQKGAVVSLREFSNNALNHHHGIQSVERFGLNVDADGDGRANEATIGDVTALAVFQASLPVPGRLLSRFEARRRAAARGEVLFSRVGCSSCHVPSLALASPIFTEPGPYNPPGNLRAADVPRPFSFDLTRDGPGPRLVPLPGGGAAVEAFTDLKRHDLCDPETTTLANELVPQGTLLGSASPSAFTVAPAPRPLRQFLTRKLWDAGNSMPYGHRGDLTTLTEAILAHGGEGGAARAAFLALADDERGAVIEFLKTLQVLPEGAPRVDIEGKRP
jgi:cytochrome c peroxidase